MITGEGTGDNCGYSVSSVGDINGDGLADLIVGASGADPGARTDAGRAYVVFGKTDSAVVRLTDVIDGVGGFVINGDPAGGNAGISVAAAGDVDGDGLMDLIVGAQGTNSSKGSAYVIHSGTTYANHTTAYWTPGHKGTAASETFHGTAGEDHILAGQGNDTIYANGGNDVIYGGAGNDTVYLNANNMDFTKLRVDLGLGYDSLHLSGSGIGLDLANNNRGTLKGIDRIDLSGQSNAVSIGHRDLQNLLDETRNMLVIDGDGSNHVWTNMAKVNGGAIVSYNSKSYYVYSLPGSTDQMYVQVGVVVN